MNEKVAYIVAEGPFDASLIKRILPDITGQPGNVGVVVAAGYSSALAITESMLIQTKRPVLLVLDAETIDELQIREKQQFVEQYIRVSGAMYQVALVAPMMEVLLFADKEAMELAIGKSIADDVWTLAKLSPKKGLELITGKSRESAVEQLMANELLRQRVAQTPLMNEIKLFVQQAQQPVSA